jgi:alpha-L-rhamnosidase
MVSFNLLVTPLFAPAWPALPCFVVACMAGSVALAAPERESAVGLRPAELRCEYRTNPLGIDVVAPRLSWIVSSAKRGQRQTAYQIRVASSEKVLNLPEGKVDLWDSGQVRSDETAAIVYAGRPLRSKERCYWRVRVWDKDGKPSAWSPSASWSMGLLNPSDWEAEWIGYDKPHDAAISKAQADKTKLILPPPSYLRTTFHVKGPVARATLYTTSLGIHDIHLNGQRITEDYFNPGWTDYSKRVYYRAYDVTDRVHPGPNALGAILADGWYSGYVGFGKMRHHYGQKTRLKAQLHLVYADGTTEVIATGQTWKAAVGPILEADFLMGETYDARREILGWDTAGFDDTRWDPVTTGAELKPLLQAHPGPPVRRFAEIAGRQWTEPKPGVYVLDLGQNFAGVPRLKIHGEPGQKITLRFAERLNPDRTIYTANLRSARCIDTYICAGKGEETWSPRFTFHGFQYIEITGLKSPPTSETVAGLALSSDTPVVGRFQCSEPMLNQLHSNGYWTQRGNFIDVPTDCPQRDERLGWTGDAQVYSRAASLNCDVQAFFTKWLVDLTDGQRADGQFPMVAPVKVAGDDGGPAWADAGVICPWTIYQVYGDRRLLERQYPSMLKFVEFCRKRCTPELLPPARFHCFGDWLSIGADTPKDVIFTAYFAQSTRLTGAAATALGKTEDAARLVELYHQIKSAFNKTYVATDGRIKGNTQAVYVLALAFGLVDGEKASQAANHLVNDIEMHNGHLTTGFVGTKDLMLVLSDIGRYDVAYSLLESDSFPSWGFSIKHGATSIWERWDGWTPEKGFQDPGMNSFAHYSFGAVYQWMVENIGGIRSDGPGYKRIVIEPHPGGRLTHAETSYKSIRGEIATAWNVTTSRLSLDVTIPSNTTASVVLPASRPEDITESGLPVSQAAGVKVQSSEGGRTSLEVDSGRYGFVAKTQ